jgi:hypothetical protein
MRLLVRIMTTSNVEANVVVVAERSEAAIDVIYRHYHNIVERSETVVLKLTAIVLKFRQIC